MKRPTLLLALLMLVVPVTAAPMQMPAPRRVSTSPTGPKIHVLLEKDIPSALVEAKGHYRVVRNDTGAKLSSGSVGKRFELQGLQQGLRWGEEYPDVYEISVIPTSADTTISVNGIQYKGVLTVYQSRDNTLTLVNEVSIEDYLKSTLAVKYEDHSLSEEAMAALTIIARTDAYTKMLERSNNSRPWEVSAREVGYFGCGISHTKTIESSVDLTRYMVLESLKDKAPMANLHLSATKADELAQKGMDAQKILKSAFPTAKIGATISADEVSIR